MTTWRTSDRFDPAALPLADRHYNRQTIGSPQYVPPSACLCFLTDCRRALWVSSWPKAEYTKHAWAGAWINSLFRNEGAGLSSTLIREAIALTCARWTPPPLGLVTFVDADEVRRKRDPGRCYLRAGFHRAVCPRHIERVSDCNACEGRTEGGLLAFQMLAHEMPAADYSLSAPLLTL